MNDECTVISNNSYGINNIMSSILFAREAYDRTASDKNIRHKAYSSFRHTYEGMVVDVSMSKDTKIYTYGMCLHMLLFMSKDD